MKNKMKQTEIATEDGVYWSDLPVEILQLILSQLPVLDHISFRSVCRSFKQASSLLLLEQQPRRQSPWLLLLNAEDDDRSGKRRKCLRLTGALGDPSTGRVYINPSPELNGTELLASKFGWLLLRKQESESKSEESEEEEEAKSLMFFFNPFSRARIDLPCLDISKWKMPCFALSAPPTSPNCIIFATGSIGFPLLVNRQIAICRRGDTQWTVLTYDDENDKSPLSDLNVAFWNDDFYVLHCSGRLSVFNASYYTWELMGNEIQGDRDSRVFPRLPRSCLMKRKRRGHFCVNFTFRTTCTRLERRFEEHSLRLRRPKRLLCKGKDLFSDSTFSVSSSKNTIKDVWWPRRVRMDSFDRYAWRAKYDEENGNQLSYHLSGFEASCSEDCNCPHVHWIEPVWVSPSLNLSWSSNS